MVLAFLIGALAPVAVGAPRLARAVDEPTPTIMVSWTRPGVPGTMSPPAALRVGDLITFTVDASEFDYASCDHIFHHVQTQGQMGGGQGVAVAVTDGEPAECRPWTFTVPPAPPGTINLHASVAGMPLAGGGELSVAAPEMELTLEDGGTPQPYQSTLPSQSWAVSDVLGGAAPSFNVDLTVAMPPGATDCFYTLNGNFTTQVIVRPAADAPCTDWAVTLPDFRPAINADGPFEAPWDGWIIVNGFATDPETGDPLQGYGMTEQLFFDGAGGEAFESNLPMVMLLDSLTPHYVVAGDSIVIDPEVRSISGGDELRCIYQFRSPLTGDEEEGQNEVRPLVDGDCEPLSFEAPVSGVYQTGASVNSLDWPGAGLAWGIWSFDPMPPPEIEVDPASAGTPFDVTSSVSAGAPAEFEFSLTEPLAMTAAPASVAGTSTSCTSGTLDFNAEERTAEGECTAQNRGSWELTVRFLDVTGAERTRTTTVHVLPPGVNPTDIIGHSFEDEIRWLYAQGITGGCATNRFCPSATLTRGEMASFLSRALGLPPTNADPFTDDEGSTHEVAINRVAAAGIATGCAPGRFCPQATVTRGQMASFLSRALSLPPTNADPFTDDEGSTHEIAINRLAAAGITGGCAPGRFCPNAPVTRAQMAAFLYRALASS